MPNVGRDDKNHTYSPTNPRAPAFARLKTNLGWVNISPFGPAPSNGTPPQALLQISSHSIISTRVDFIPKPHG